MGYLVTLYSLNLAAWLVNKMVSQSVSVDITISAKTIDRNIVYNW